MSGINVEFEELLGVEERQTSPLRVHKMGANFRKYILNMPSEESRKLLAYLVAQQDNGDSNFLDGKEKIVTVNGLTAIILWYDDPEGGEIDESGWVLFATEASPL